MSRRSSFYRRYGKRAVDLVLVLPAMVVLAPVAIVLAATIRFTAGSPVLFRQVRPGLRERPFTILKFRTMADRRDPAGDPLPDEERLTRIGRVLRATSLDELPELWNVLRGEMSLVGPRPLLVRYLERYDAEQRRRHEVRPGITGWAQINGRNALAWEEKFRHDLWYVDHLSLGLDLKILAITVWRVLSRHGITADGHSTMPEFEGKRE